MHVLERMLKIRRFDTVARTDLEMIRLSHCPSPRQTLLDLSGCCVAVKLRRKS